MWLGYWMRWTQIESKITRWRYSAAISSTIIPILSFYKTR